MLIPVADPELPIEVGRGHQPLILEPKPIICQGFCRKLHENGKKSGIWGWWERAYLATSLGSANVSSN